MVSLNAPNLTRLAKFLEKYNLRSAVTQLAGLLTAPSLQANTIRIETAVHLAVANCQGRHKPGLTEIGHWLNRDLGDMTVAHLEDPSEDVFVTNVSTPQGNRRIFQGIWESDDYFVQTVIDLLTTRPTLRGLRSLLDPVLALLTISDHVAQRVGLERWHSEPSDPKGKIPLTSAIQLTKRARAVTFSNNDLASLGIDRDLLAPFLLQPTDQQIVATETIGNTSLERHPLVDCGGTLVLVLPHAVSPAIRRYVLAELLQKGRMSEFSLALQDYQANQVQMEGLQELKTDIGPLAPPAPDRNGPALHSWLCKYDIDKYLHVVLLHDRLDLLARDGLTSFMRYRPTLATALADYLQRTANYCTSLPDFRDGTTLLIMGGLGRGFALSPEAWPNHWHSSVIRISQFLALADERDRPVTRYLKCIHQKDQLEETGVNFLNVNGDYNLYCYWREADYQLVPRDLPVEPGSQIVLWTDHLFPTRQKVRRLVDHHVALTSNGSWIPVRRFHTDEFFGSLQDRPIYVSVPHLRSGIFGGEVESPRGPNWFCVTSHKGDEKRHRFLYDMWRGFIELYDRLVFHFESCGIAATTDPIEVHLDLSNVAMFEDSSSLRSGLPSEPPIAIKINQQTATIMLPPNLLQYFQQPDNAGERLVLRNIARALVRLRKTGNVADEDSLVNTLTNRVLNDPAIRILHAMPITDPVDILRERVNPQPVFLAPEDYSFAKLNLWEDSNPITSGSTLTSKADCKQFLNSLVEKIWRRVGDRLRQLDRTSVIREVLQVHEAFAHDRDHWDRTARALLALYQKADDVFMVARDREAQRATAGLASRTILEMAACECPKVGGRCLSRWELDELLADVTLMLEAATDSDAINNDLGEPRIELYLNGEYTMSRDFHKTVMAPFFSAQSQEAFKNSAQEYGELYQTNRFTERKPVDEIYPPEMIAAFQAEFGLTVDAAVAACAELIDLAIERDSVVVDTTLGDIKNQLTSNRNLTVETVEAFVRNFGLFPRESWETPPKGFARKDIYPWRFSRRLSVVVRPLLIFGKEDTDKVLFGVGALRVGIAYLLDKIEQGHLSQDFFTSRTMRQYMGKVNHQKGHAFAQTVSAQMTETKWRTRVEVQMTELTGPAELGDVDVLAWKANGEIQIIECKRLQFARTVGEAADICGRFQGEAKDELAKHLRRIEWIKANPTRLQHIVGFVPKPNDIDHRLVTNVPVPMTYLTSLPMPADKIGPLK